MGNKSSSYDLDASNKKQDEKIEKASKKEKKEKAKIVDKSASVEQRSFSGTSSSNDENIPVVEAHMRADGVTEVQLIGQSQEFHGEGEPQQVLEESDLAIDPEGFSVEIKTEEPQPLELHRTHPPPTIELDAKPSQSKYEKLGK